MTVDPNEPHIALMPQDDLDLSALIALLTKTVNDAPAEAPVIVLAFTDSAQSQAAHSRRKNALTAVLDDAAPRLGPGTRIFGLTPGFPDAGEPHTTDALADAVALATHNQGMTGQMVVFTPD